MKQTSEIRMILKMSNKEFMERWRTIMSPDRKPERIRIGTITPKEKKESQYVQIYLTVCRKIFLERILSPRFNGNRYVNCAKKYLVVLGKKPTYARMEA